MIMIMIMIIIIIIIIVILACPDARCESGQTSGSCRNIILHHCILSQEL
jgi:CDP-diacylglycerol pyrophosphatase